MILKTGYQTFVIHEHVKSLVFSCCLRQNFDFDKYCTVNMVIISTMWEHWTGMISWKCVDMAWYEFVCKLIQHSGAFRGSYITSQGHITLHWNRLFALVACTALDCSADIYIIYVWTLWPLSEGRVAEPKQNINFEHTLSIPSRYVRLLDMLNTQYFVVNLIFVAADPSLAL